MELITKNGNKKFIINFAGFKNAVKLKNAAADFLLKNGVHKNLGDFKEANIASLLDKVFELLLSAETSDKFNDALFGCLESCIYDETFKINKQLFDDKPEIIEDYYEIVSNCIEVNLRPFFKSLVAELKTRLNQIPETLKL